VLATTLSRLPHGPTRPPPPHARFSPSLSRIPVPRLFRRRPSSPSPAYAAPSPPLLHHRRTPPRIHPSSITECRPGSAPPPSPSVVRCRGRRLRPYDQARKVLVGCCGERGGGGCRRRPYYANGRGTASCLIRSGLRRLGKIKDRTPVSSSSDGIRPVLRARAALCSFVKAQFDKAEERRLLECFPSLRDLPAQEREEYLRWLMGKEERECEYETYTPEPPAWLRRYGPCSVCAARRRDAVGVASC
ncbi:hypothetical protein U9M48_033683, partial [Paspalum notatum var. saurae]